MHKGFAQTDDPDDAKAGLLWIIKSNHMFDRLELHTQHLERLWNVTCNDGNFINGFPISILPETVLYVDFICR